MAGKTKGLLGKVWDFIWNDNSLLSWIVNVLLAFVLIKYVLFPVLGLILGSTFPVVAVVSTSMEHDSNFENWWNSPAYCERQSCTQGKFYEHYNITKEQFEKFSFKNGFNKGDVMILTSAKNPKIGDIVVFFAADGRPIIHRLIALNPLQTKGDHNAAQITSVPNEKNVDNNSLIGIASFKIPFIGYVKIWFVELFALFGVHLA